MSYVKATIKNKYYTEIYKYYSGRIGKKYIMLLVWVKHH